jgi:hypothetical protein
MAGETEAPGSRRLLLFRIKARAGGVLQAGEAAGASGRRTCSGDGAFVERFTRAGEYAA